MAERWEEGKVIAASDDGAGGGSRDDGTPRECDEQEERDEGSEHARAPEESGTENSTGRNENALPDENHRSHCRTRLSTPEAASDSPDLEDASTGGHRSKKQRTRSPMWLLGPNMSAHDIMSRVNYRWYAQDT